MRLVFCGTALFAVPSLRACAAHHEVLAVVTRADRLGNRGKPAPRPVADAAHELGLPVLMPAKIGAPEVVRGLLDLIPDSVVVAAYGQILPVALLDPLPFGAVNVHASLLPRWRGARRSRTRSSRATLETGVSIMRMEAGLDTGPVYATARVPIGDDATTPALTARRSPSSAPWSLISVLERARAWIGDRDATAGGGSDVRAASGPGMTAGLTGRHGAPSRWIGWSARCCRGPGVRRADRRRRGADPRGAALATSRSRPNLGRSIVARESRW